MQAASCHPMADRVVTQSQPLQLPARHDPVLLPDQPPGAFRLSAVDFRCHSPGK